MAKLGVLLPAPKSVTQGETALLEIPKGPGKGKDLALVGGATPQLLGRNASKELWTREEIMSHMMSPKLKCKPGKEPRTDFSPIRKKLFKGLSC